jgi:diacylglycerol kinase (ATP)
MTDPQRILIFANPIAGRGKGRVLAGRLQERFRQVGWEAETLFDRADAVSDVVIQGATAVVSIGGDGTLRSVVTRVTDNGAREGPGVLVVPMGTANLMGRHLGVGLSEKGLEERAVAAITNRRVARLDVGVLMSNVKGQMSNVEERKRELFLLMVGVGLDGEIVHALDKVRKGPIGYVSYIRPALETLAGYQFHPIAVEVDGHRVFKSAPAVAFVGNVKEYGTGFEILPQAKSDDELLDVCVLPARTPGDLIKHFLLAAAGEHLQGEGVVYVKGKRVRVTSPAAVAVQADGDPAGYTPVDIELLKTRVVFLT